MGEFLRGSRPTHGSLDGNTGSYNAGMSKVMISLPQDLLQRIDEEAKRRSISRSALIASAARRELARPNPDAVAEAIARSEARFLRSGAFESSAMVREQRDAIR